jgi:hypothetical protein
MYISFWDSRKLDTTVGSDAIHSHQSSSKWPMTCLFYDCHVMVTGAYMHVHDSCLMHCKQVLNSSVRFPGALAVRGTSQHRYTSQALPCCKARCIGLAPPRSTRATAKLVQSERDNRSLTTRGAKDRRSGYVISVVHWQRQLKWLMSSIC